MVKAINAKGFAGITTGQMNEMEGLAKNFGAKGLASIKVENGEWKSPIVKFFSETEKQRPAKSGSQIEEGDLILFARRRVGNRLRSARPPASAHC